MSQEQPTFKVKDRRLFNADGSLREDIEREAPPPGGTPPVENSSAASTTPAASESAPSSASAPKSESFDAAGIPGADDPASFANFLMSIATNAATALGLMDHPATGMRAVDLPLAKHWIDVLGMLQHKTRGNLSLQEQHLLDGLLADMRMQYVALTSPPAARRTYSGKDITGGR
jgi:hypothetical protein